MGYDARSNVETVQDGETAGSAKPLLPSYRTNPKARTIDVGAMRRSLERILAWDFNRCLACHTDPIDGEEARTLIRQAWSWVWECGIEHMPSLVCLHTVTAIIANKYSY